MNKNLFFVLTPFAVSERLDSFGKVNDSGLFALEGSTEDEIFKRTGERLDFLSKQEEHLSKNDAFVSTTFRRLMENRQAEVVVVEEEKQENSWLGAPVRVVSGLRRTVREQVASVCEVGYRCAGGVVNCGKEQCKDFAAELGTKMKPHFQAMIGEMLPHCEETLVEETMSKMTAEHVSKLGADLVLALFQNPDSTADVLCKVLHSHLQTHAAEVRRDTWKKLEASEKWAAEKTKLWNAFLNELTALAKAKAWNAPETVVRGVKNIAWSLLVSEDEKVDPVNDEDEKASEVSQIRNEDTSSW